LTRASQASASPATPHACGSTARASRRRNTGVGHPAGTGEPEFHRRRGCGEAWQQKLTLLDSGPQDKVFRVETDDDGDATVVFGDGVFGLRPDETSEVKAAYRVGGERS